jgi:hypothetical protein
MGPLFSSSDERLKDLAPHLFTKIPRRLSRSRLVKDNIDGGWLDDIPTDLDAIAIDELLAVADSTRGGTDCRRGSRGRFPLELGPQGDLFCEVLLPWHVQW